MRTFALWLIRQYQQHLSPKKGFRCAYRVHTGRCSCSALGYRAIRRFGLWHGTRVLRQRLLRCGIAYRRYRHSMPLASALASQRGDCDCACDFPDPGHCSINDTAELLDCCDCNWPSRKRRNEASTYLPRRH
ncbi:membrane protein insertion efficiency factor YidD [Chitinilyticum piscinae]|uniref:Membrane protein insertion efficiency factor YidD n=1 Tax=Chitinilyticum piscinae TaxID=2866724 RepID=A0A8J7FEN1_9NEIS|nr:membrane protein insertion efficiency factor YidD [Chitinilyticum piscinae]MBE9608013.1 membrane protein insertion efficiency factor YidD [Chitinilyticum piscinae]